MNQDTPKAQGFYMPAEWQTHKACFMAWPCHETTWERIGFLRAYKAYATVAEAIAQYEPVIFLVRPKDLAQAKNYLGSAYELIPMPLTDSWTRDTAPTFLEHKDKNQKAGIAWKFNAWGGNYADFAHDAQLATNILQHLQMKRFQAPIFMEGGAVHVNGAGTFLTTEECLLHPSRNPSLSKQKIEAILHDHLGTDKAIWLPNGLIDDETDGHVDEVATFVSENHVLALITSDTKDSNYQRLQENLEALKIADVTVTTMEQVPAQYQGETRLSLSYINFYLANGGIVMPAFGFSDYDAEAYKVMQQVFPDYKITQIPAIDVFTGGGGIHCITQQQPQ